MKASFDGHVDIVRLLIEANVQINTQREVRMMLLPPDITLHYHTVYV